MERIAVLTSGGDAPGMNAAIRAVVRTGICNEWEVLGVKNGYAGLVAGNFEKLSARDVGGIIQLGGTMLGSARCPEFKEEETRRNALRELNKRAVDALVVIGGNGSQAGANALSQMGFPVVGIASTVDNDLFGTDISLGVDSALNVVLEAIDRLKVTGASHQRAFLVEVMGRNCGYLALMSGLAGGAEAIILPEDETELEEVVAKLQRAYDRGKTHALIVVAEGAKYNASACYRYFEEHGRRLGFELRFTILGHVQRGAQPSARDRILGSRFGGAATDCLARGEYGQLVGLLGGKIATTPLEVVVTETRRPNLDQLELARKLEV